MSSSQRLVVSLGPKRAGSWPAMLALCLLWSSAPACTVSSERSGEQTASQSSWLTNAEVVPPGTDLYGYAAFVESFLPGGM